jgi:hypothetical protein
MPIQPWSWTWCKYEKKIKKNIPKHVSGIMVPEIAAYHALWDEEPKPLQAKQSDNEENSSEEQEMKVYLK